MKDYFKEFESLKHNFQNVIFPEQEFFFDYKSLKEWFKIKKCFKDNVLIVYDGVYKNHHCLEPKELLDFFLKDLFPCSNVIILRDVLHTQSNINASQNNLNVLKTILKSKGQYEYIIGLGSGVLIDLLKHACYESKTKAKLISIPTALSVSAYTSKISIISKDGLKESLDSRLPDAILWIAPLLQAAPLEFTQAGFGDIVCIPYAQSDWLLSSIIGFQNFSPKYIEIFSRYKESLSAYAPEYSKSPPSFDAINFLSFMVSLGGVFMTSAGGSWPVSGYEHAISHALDFVKDLTLRRKVLHGQQVALGTYSSACLFDWFLSPMPKREYRPLFERKALRKFLQSLLRSFPLFDKKSINSPQKDKENSFTHLQDTLFKKIPSLESRYMEKQALWQSFRASNKDEDLNKVKRTIKDFIFNRYELQRILNDASLPLIAEETKPQTLCYEYRWALRFAPFIRTRFCLGDLVFWMGEDPCYVLGL